MRREVDESCALLGYYAVSSDNFLPTYWDNLRGCRLHERRIHKRKPTVPKGVYTGKRGCGDMFSVAWCKPRGLMQVVGREAVCVNQSNFEERRSVREEILTGAIARHRRAYT